MSQITKVEIVDGQLMWSRSKSDGNRSETNRRGLRVAISGAHAQLDRCRRAAKRTIRVGVENVDS